MEDMRGARGMEWRQATLNTFALPANAEWIFTFALPANPEWIFNSRRYSLFPLPTHFRQVCRDKAALKGRRVVGAATVPRLWFVCSLSPVCPAPLALALKPNELDRRGHLMKAAEEPDEKDDRDRYADQPKQKTSTHNFLLLVASQPNVGSELKFHARSQPQCRRR
jgi:hypothetical protein